jgi:hypothetical protein
MLSDAIELDMLEKPLDDQKPISPIALDLPRRRSAHAAGV